MSIEVLLEDLKEGKISQEDFLISSLTDIESRIAAKVLPKKPRFNFEVFENFYRKAFEKLYSYEDRFDKLSAFFEILSGSLIQYTNSKDNKDRYFFSVLRNNLLSNNSLGKILARQANQAFKEEFRSKKKLEEFIDKYNHYQDIQFLLKDDKGLYKLPKFYKRRA